MGVSFLFETNTHKLHNRDVQFSSFNRSRKRSLKTACVRACVLARACVRACVCVCVCVRAHAFVCICNISPRFLAVYTQERLQAVRSLHRYLRDDFLTTKHINIQTSLSSHPMLALDRNIYKWGRRSENVHLEVGVGVGWGWG